MIKPKPRKCSHCKTPFPIFNSMSKVKWCSDDCALILVDKALGKIAAGRAKAERADIRVRKKRIKTRSDYMKGAQAAWNSYVRWRDHGKPCASCGVVLTHKPGGHNIDCSHYRSVGSAPHMRFHLHNAAAACVRCNRNLSGNVAELRKGIIARIGLAKIEAVEADNTVRKFDVDYLQRIKRIFNKKALRAEKRIKRME